MGDWGVTVADVLNETGENVTDSNVSVASATVELHLNLTPAGSAYLHPRDLHWVKTAIKWQAAWVPGQPDLAKRQGLTGISQDGVTAQFRAEHSVLLSPFAARALKNLSTKSWRTIEQASKKFGVGVFRDISEEASDELHRWEPL